MTWFARFSFYNATNTLKAINLLEKFRNQTASGRRILAIGRDAFNIIYVAREQETGQRGSAMAQQ